MIRIAVDAMGGDNAPGEIVKGAVDAVSKRSDIQVLLTGQEEVVRKELEKYSVSQDRITIVPASEIIATDEPPVNAIRRKKDSSIVVGMNLVKKGEADAFVSAGNSGAVLVGGQMIVGRGYPFFLTAVPMWTPDRPIWFSLHGWVLFTWNM